MGGFALHNADRSFLRVLTKSDLEQLYNEGRIEWPAISEKEIRDRSKADIFSKGIVLLQTTWFIIQCVSRFATKLPVMELEVATLAFAILNSITYWLWWHKLSDVRCAMPVYLKTLEDFWPSSTSSTPNKEVEDINLLFFFIDRHNKLGLVPVIAYIARWAPANTFITHATALANHRAAALTKDNSHVPTFYSVMIPSSHRYLPYYSLAQWTTFGVIGLFGIIHFIPWSSAFPNATEKWLWRVSAILITTTPFLLAAAEAIVDVMAIKNPTNQEVCTNLKFYIVLALSAVYIVSRIILLILPLVLLHNLPPRALLELKWSEFLPHI